jgi:hypothetical protein
MMLLQEVYSALVVLFLIGISWLGEHLTQRIDVEVLSEENEVSLSAVWF